MKKYADPKLNTRIQAAIEELKALIMQHYPGTTFRLGRDPEEPEVTLLEPVVDVDDRTEVMDVILDRLVEMQVDEDLPIMVMIDRTDARNEAIRRVLRAEAAANGAGGPSAG